MRLRLSMATLAVALGLAAVLPAARGAPAEAPASKTKAAKPPSKTAKADGMKPSLFVGLNFAFGQSESVVGVPDGISLALGLTLRAGLDFSRGPHRWITRLDVILAVTKVPGLDPVITGTDRIEVTSFYTYRVPRLRWLSVYGGLRVGSKLLEGQLVRRADTALQLTATNGAVFTDLVPAQTPYPLTDFLAPLILEQASGVGFTPLRLTAARLDLRLGLLAHEAVTQGGYAEDDDPATPATLELIQLRDYVQGGFEAEAALRGRVADRLLAYAVSARLVLPVLTSVETDLRYDRLIHLELRAALSLRLFSWASLEYSLLARRLELLRPGWQVASLLLLSVHAQVGQAPGGAP